MIGLGVIRCLAAVAWEQEKPLVIETVEVYPPRNGEVRIRMKAAAICETDVHALSGSVPGARFPCILGHEGAGVVESVGPGVSSFEPGDHVIPLHKPHCGECRYCLSKETNLCNKISFTQEQGLMPDGTARFVCKGKRVFHFMGCSTFSEYTIVSIHSLCKIDSRASLDKVCLLGCGVSTGYGAPFNVAAVKEGSSCAIFGLNAVGVAVAMGCRARGAKIIVGYDDDERKLLEFRNFKGKVFGFTDIIHLGEHITESMQRRFNGITVTDEDFDYTFECNGDRVFIKNALQFCNEAWGQSFIVGVEACQEVRDDLSKLTDYGRVWKGSTFGGWKGKESVPNLVTQYLEKKLDLDSFITEKLRFEEINEGFRLLQERKSIRSVVYYRELSPAGLSHLC